MNNNEDIAVFAETNYRNKKLRFGIKTDDRRRHIYIIGKTGMGKTTMLENMVYSDLVSGHGLAVVDPHGDFAEKLLDYVPKNRINDVIYFNPADMNFPIAFNVMEQVKVEHRHLVASGLIGVFKKIWADSWGPRLEYVLRNAILALLEYPGSTLLGVPRILVDKNYRKKVVAKVTDPVVKAFWVDEFSKYSNQFLVDAISPIQNKVGQFLSSSLVRNIVSQTKSAIELRDIMDNQKILIINLAKGRIGEDYSALLGAMMITKIQLAAMGRVDIPEDQRKDFYLYVDEFQNFATESFATILSEARKYHLNLTIAHQYIGQLVNDSNTTVRDAVFGNVGTLITFRVGAQDAEFLEKEFEPVFVINDIVNLPKHHIYLKLMIDGVTSTPFSATTLPPLAKISDTDTREKIIRSSRERYSTNRKVIEEKIARWSGVADEGDKGAEASSEAAGNKNSKPRNFDESRNSGRSFDNDNGGNPGVKMFSAVCKKCGVDIKVPFEPDPKRATYCKKCLKEVRSESRSRFNDAPSVYSSYAPATRLNNGLKANSEPKTEPVKVAPTAANPPRQNQYTGETAVESVPSISLEEALSQKPIPFRQKNKPEAADKETSSGPVVAKAPLKISSVPNDDKKIIKPGERVRVKFD